MRGAPGCLGWIWGGALSARASEGLSYDLDPGLTCPSPIELRTALEAQLGALPSRSKRDWLDRHTLKVSPAAAGALSVELIDSPSGISFRRSVPQGSCQAQAEAVALLTLTWVDQGTSLPEPAIGAPAVPPEVSSAPETSSSPPTAAANRSDWHPLFEPRLGIGGLLPASTASPFGASVEASLQIHLTRWLGVAARGGWFTPLHATSIPIRPAPSTCAAIAVGCDLSWTGPAAAECNGRRLWASRMRSTRSRRRATRRRTHPSLRLLSCGWPCSTAGSSPPACSPTRKGAQRSGYGRSASTPRTRKVRFRF